MNDDTFHAASIAWLFSIIGVALGAFLGLWYALAVILSVAAVAVAVAVAGYNITWGPDSE